jgi:hypothetical protein
MSVPGFKAFSRTAGEKTMNEEFELVDLGDAKEETRYGHFVPPTDGITEYVY